MRGLGATFRLLTLAVCLVPFTNTQQATGAFALFRLAAPVPAGEVPDAPANEEEDEQERREEVDGKERHAPQSRCLILRRELGGTLRPVRATHQSHVTKRRTVPPVAADPLRNGLGTHYRC